MADNKRNFDVDGFYNALDLTRTSRKLNWKQVGAESSVSASTLTRLAQNKTPDAAGLASLAAWAGLNPADFVAGVKKATHEETLAAISKFLRNDPKLTGTSAGILEGMVREMYVRLVGQPAAEESQKP
jgi:transcriptional regulator with XRE-family HTH domain